MVTVENLIARLQSPMHDQDSSQKFQWLRHMKMNDKYEYVEYTWPSPYIRRRVFMQLREIGATFLKRIDLLANASYIKSGNLYGDYVTHSLQCGPPRQLLARDTTGDSCSIQFPSSYIIFANSDVISNIKKGVLYIPLEKNKESIDLVIPPYMLQITAAKSHTIKAKGIEAIKGAFPKILPNDWKVCFVIPSRNQSAFKQPRCHLGVYTLNYDYSEEVKFKEVSELESLEDVTES